MRNHTLANVSVPASAIPLPSGFNSSDFANCTQELWVPCPCIYDNYNTTVPRVGFDDNGFGGLSCNNLTNLTECFCNATYYQTTFPVTSDSTTYGFWMVSPLSPLFSFLDNSA